ncbi:hypothetical protein C6380_13710 [Pseudomonas syringae pv. actinidiae]|uniref:hypothetical protein n=1 Tax=Pseudomonas syringae TaxID=317 RepID=UPI000BB55A9F|nr:hypothetical protein [Pseudomonas syringae]PBK49637.1 hypothetical protein BUE60_23855 [Pseudomonas syringae pv. actinidiae]PBK50516.1 hypothetical protein BUE61_19850 [Pseudomonas syringae pv. actinidiae]RJX53789.1 hypothetical protein C6379_16810 [Pseudomonas syringae pv. actinidiae]RJX55849.1 hypothetical protein C6380_13710 [Pseudomonas syringae pv. actinidiae]RJX58164.1 hypothetical protein C6383_18200 [Pseudomonas syringae pv. actinidiae]
MPHTVLRIFGAHSNSTEEKAKRAINRLPCKLTKTAATSLPALRHAAEIIDTGKINDSKKSTVDPQMEDKKMPGYRAFFFASAAAYKL